MIKIPEKLVLLKKKRFYVPLGALVLLVVYFFVKSGNSTQNYETATVKRSSISQEVLVSGKVNPKDKVELSFEQSGRVARVYVDTGTRVVEGQTLASLSNGDVVATLDRARATLLSVEANLAQVKRGARPEEVAVKESELDKAKQDLQNFYQSVPNTLSDALDVADDAVTKRLDLLFSNDDSTSPILTFLVGNQQLKVSIEDSRRRATEAIASLRALIAKANSTSSSDDLEKSLRDAKTSLLVVRTLLVQATDALGVSTDLSATTLASYKADVTTARSEVTTAITATETLLNSIVSQKIAVQKTRDELNLQKAGNTTEDVEQAEAKVAEALADVRKAEANVAKTIIRAPFSGVITNKNVSVGQIVAANSPVLSIISLGNFEIEANIPEVEIAKLTVGNTATVTLDAYGNDVPFLATVTVIDPAERVIDGVSTYEVTLNFKEEDARIRSGMTANLEIKTAEKDDVVIIPERAVVIEGNKKIVEVLDGTGNSIKREVQTGLRGQGGVVEITQGLKEGETIIVSRTK